MYEQRQPEIPHLLLFLPECGKQITRGKGFDTPIFLQKIKKGNKQVADILRFT
jgi:hypothetical protein